MNHVQSLVWGGKLESIQVAKPRKDKAIVKFLTPEGCAKYFAMTANGITLPGLKTCAFVEQGPGPNSLNDVLRACIDGVGSRCIRAYDADDDWLDGQLHALAKGKSQPLRVVDHIKRGVTAKGVSDYVSKLYDLANSFKAQVRRLPIRQHLRCLPIQACPRR